MQPKAKYSQQNRWMTQCMLKCRRIWCMFFMKGLHTSILADTSLRPAIPIRMAWYRWARPCHSPSWRRRTRWSLNASTFCPGPASRLARSSTSPGTERAPHGFPWWHLCCSTTRKSPPSLRPPRHPPPPTCPHPPQPGQGPCMECRWHRTTKHSLLGARRLGRQHQPARHTPRAHSPRGAAGVPIVCPAPASTHAPNPPSIAATHPHPRWPPSILAAAPLLC